MKTRVCDWCGDRFILLHALRKCCSDRCRWARQRERERNSTKGGSVREDDCEYMPDEATIWAEAARLRELMPREPQGYERRPVETVEIAGAR